MRRRELCERAVIDQQLLLELSVRGGIQLGVDAQGETRQLQVLAELGGLVGGEHGEPYRARARRRPRGGPAGSQHVARRSPGRALIRLEDRLRGLGPGVIEPTGAYEL